MLLVGGELMAKARPKVWTLNLPLKMSLCELLEGRRQIDNWKVEQVAR